MSIQNALETIGITQDEYEMVLKVRPVLKKGNSAEIKRNIKENKTVVYEVEKRKK